MGLLQQPVLPQISGSANSAFTTATTSTTILRVTATGAIPTGTFVLTCTSNIAVNGAAGAVTFDIASTKDTSALTGQTGYAITAASSDTTAPTFTSAVVIGNWSAPSKVIITFSENIAANTNIIPMILPSQAFGVELRQHQVVYLLQIVHLLQQQQVLAF